MTTNLHKAQIKQLRADARKLVAIARHLRDEAMSLAMEEKAEKVRANFYSKRASVDPSIALIPDILEEKKELLF